MPFRRARILLLAAAVCAAPGCTLFDDYTSGTPFTPDQPVKELSVVGEVNIDRSSGSRTCPDGRALFWGTVRNTGQIDVDSVSIIVDAYDAAGVQLGSFSGTVYNGTVETGEGIASDTAGTNLEVDQSGSFSVCSTLGFGSVARAEGRADGFAVETFGTQ